MDALLHAPVAVQAGPDDPYLSLLQHAREQPQAFWGAQARRIDWQQPIEQVLDDSRAPFARWFVGARTNLCHNAVDRHLATRGDQTAFIFASGETGQEQRLSYRELYIEVNAMAATLRELGVQAGQRVLIYLPMVMEAAIAMLACARIGAVHAVVFGGFAPASLAARIRDAEPALVVCADAGFQHGQLLPYKDWLEQAMLLAQAHGQVQLNCPRLVVDRGLRKWAQVHGRDHAWHALRQRHLGAVVPCHWLESNAPSYLLYTSGTTGQPKGVQRDTGGHAVALATSMDLMFQARPGEVIFTTSDLGWVVGHSYGVYGPLLAGMTSLLYEGSPTRPHADIWWHLAQRHGVHLMLSSATAMRLLGRSGSAARPARPALPCLRALFLAGEPLDEATAAAVTLSLGRPVIDHYWQTETGAPMIGLPPDTRSRRAGSPGLAAPGWTLRVVDEESGRPCAAGQRGLLVAHGVLPPGCLSTLWQRDAAFVSTYWQQRDGQWQYSTFDWATQDADGQIRVLGRADDVINVAGKRIGTREIEEVLLAQPGVAEVAVVGMRHRLRGQVPVAFVVPRGMPGKSEPSERQQFSARLVAAVAASMGALARPRKVVLVQALPRTRSGKVLRRMIRECLGGGSQADLPADELRDVMQALAQAFAAT